MGKMGISRLSVIQVQLSTETGQIVQSPLFKSLSVMDSTHSHPAAPRP